MLNTWHARPNGTYFSPDSTTQIDYVITRQASARLQAKRAYPDHHFPVGGGRLTGHYPIRAQLPLQSFGCGQASALPADRPASAAIDLLALQAAVSQALPPALAMQARVAERLAHIDISHLASAHRHLNRILLEEATAAFPKDRRRTTVSVPGRSFASQLDMYGTCIMHSNALVSARRMLSSPSGD